jgi:hypothetical protein
LNLVLFLAWQVFVVRLCYLVSLYVGGPSVAQISFYLLFHSLIPQKDPKVSRLVIIVYCALAVLQTKISRP